MQIKKSNRSKKIEQPAEKFEPIQIYPLPDYKITKKKESEIIEEHEIDDVIEMLTKYDKGYHLKIHNKKIYIFFGDLDHMTCDILEWSNDFIPFFNKEFSTNITFADISYTKNKLNNGSFHYSIPKFSAPVEKIKSFHIKFNNEFGDKYTYQSEKEKKTCVDISIYGEKWFRMPLQSKASDKETIHEIIQGQMKDFIVSHIPKNTISLIKKNNDTIIDDLDNIELIDNKNNEPDITPKIEDKTSIEMRNKMKKYEHCNKFMTYKRFFDECYKPERFSSYNDWISVGMALKNIYGDDAFELFDYYSKKGSNYEGTFKTLQKYNSFKRNVKCKGIGTLYHFAKKDNKTKYAEILKCNDLTLTEKEFSEKLFELAGDKFVYIKVGEQLYHLYSFNSKYWERDDILIRKFIHDELLEDYKQHVLDVYWGDPNFSKLNTQIKILKRTPFKDILIRTYKEFAIKQIEFDSEWSLFGFNNKLYDLKTHNFRDYQKDDYVSITTGYDWQEPIEEEMNTMNNIISKIMPNPEIRQLYLEILSTGLEGRCLEKFIIFNGDGRNGKGLIDDMFLIALGHYGFSANNSLLFEKSKTGSNPEKVNLHKKRFVVFKEPPSKNKFENSIVKELTGGGKFSARNHHEKETEKMLYSTIIVECNKKPLFAEEPTNAETGRLIDLPFSSIFTDIKEDIDESKHIYEAVKEFKELPFQNKHKFALLKILMEAHKSYSQNNYTFQIPQSIKDRTSEYLESSCQLYQWFKENYDESNDKNIFISIKDIYDEFKCSDYYTNLTKFEKRKLTYKNFIEYFSHNIVTKKHYRESIDQKINNKRVFGRNILLFWKIKDPEFKIDDNYFINPKKNDLDYVLDEKEDKSEKVNHEYSFISTDQSINQMNIKNNVLDVNIEPIKSDSQVTNIVNNDNIIIDKPITDNMNPDYKKLEEIRNKRNIDMRKKTQLKNSKLILNLDN